MKIGFTSTTFRQIKNIEKIIEIAKKANADFIEWGADIHVKSVEDAKKAKKLCEKYSLKISSYGSYYIVGSFANEQWSNICLISKELGAKTIRVWLGKKSSRKTTKEEFEKLVSDAKRICKEAKKYGLIVAPECHNNTYNDNYSAFLKLKNEVNENNFKTYFQSRYTDIGADFKRIENTIDLTSHIHISYSEAVRMQFFAKKDKEYINKLIEKLKEENYKGDILLEYTYFGSPTFFIKDINKLRKQIEK